MVLNEREKRMENETLASEFLNMQKVNEELISKCRSLEKEIDIHRAISHKKKSKSRRKMDKMDKNSPFTNQTTPKTLFSGQNEDGQYRLQLSPKF
jgi:hypothetical protein